MTPTPPLTCKTVWACCIFHRKTKSLATRYEISAADCTIYGIQLKNKRLVRQKVYDHTILIERFVARITKSAKILIFKQHLRSLLESDMIILAQRIFPTMCISQQTLITQLFWNQFIQTLMKKQPGCKIHYLNFVQMFSFQNKIIIDPITHH